VSFPASQPASPLKQAIIHGACRVSICRLALAEKLKAPWKRGVKRPDPGAQAAREARRLESEGGGGGGGGDNQLGFCVRMMLVGMAGEGGMPGVTRGAGYVEWCASQTQRTSRGGRAVSSYRTTTPENHRALVSAGVCLQVHVCTSVESVSPDEPHAWSCHIRHGMGDDERKHVVEI
jgi:hypothetical protein